MYANLAFLDMETISLQRDYRHVWEIGLILPGDNSQPDREFSWFVRDVPLAEADPMSLQMNHFYERYPAPDSGSDSGWLCRGDLAKLLAPLTAGRSLAGNMVSFDELRLEQMLRANGYAPAWDYHLVDVSALAAGYLIANHQPPAVPWKSAALARALGVDPDQFEGHTALGDCKLARAMLTAAHP